jgi:acyl-CoA thioester hydrolase
VVLDFATDAWFNFIGLTREHRQRHNITTFSLEAHITYQREVAEGDPLRFTTRLLDFDAKRIHYFHEMYHAGQGYLAATNELMSLHVSRETRRAAPLAPEIQQRLAQIKQVHDGLPLPPQAGRSIGLQAKTAGKV